MKITALKGKARRNAIENTRTEIHEAFHFDTKNYSDSLLEELANDYFFNFDENGNFKV